MYTALSRRRVTSALVEARAHSELHGLDDDLVFALNAIETRARSGVALARVPHEWEERDARPVDGQGRDQVHRHAPRVHVEHRGREEPEVVSRHGAFVIGVAARERERGFARLRDAELHYGKALELDGVLPVVERRRETRMHVRDVKALEVVVDVERPVRVDEIIACARGIERELAERKPVETAAHRRHELIERHRWRERDHEESCPSTERDRGQVVGWRRKVHGPLELGHRVEAPVQREAAAVITAAQLLLMARTLDDERAAVGADIRHAVELVFLVARQEEGLIERARQQREGMHLPGDLHEVVVPGVVPRPREETLPLQPEDLGIRVHTSGKGSRDADVRIYLEKRIAHSGVCRLATGVRRSRDGRDKLELIAKVARDEEVLSNVLPPRLSHALAERRIAQQVEGPRRALFRTRDEVAGDAILDLDHDAAHLPRHNRDALPEAFGDHEAEPFAQRLLDHDLGCPLERVDFAVLYAVEVCEQEDVRVAAGMFFRTVQVLLALGIVVGERADHDELNLAHLFLYEAIGVDDSERVLPGIETRDLQEDRPRGVHPELADDLARLIDRHVLVLHREGIDRRRLDEHLLLQIGPHELRHRPDGGVVLLHERPQEFPHRLVRSGEVDVAAPDPAGALRLLRA